MPEPPRLLQSVPVTSYSGVELAGWPQASILHRHTRAEPPIRGFCLLSAPEGKGREVLQKARALEEGDPGTRAAHAPGWGDSLGTAAHRSCAAAVELRWRCGAVGPPSPAPAQALPTRCLFLSDGPVLGLAENFGTERSLPLGEGLSLNEKYFDANV